MDPQSFCLSEEEVEHLYEESSLVKPYWDPKLCGDRDLRRRFFLALRDRGLLSFRRRISSTVGLFFVRKKLGWIHMVIDARRTNQLHRVPPHVPLGSARAWSMLDLSHGPAVEAELWSAALLPDHEQENGVFAAGGDMCDGFYQFSNEDLAEDFGFDFPETAEYYSCSSV